ncbi:MAG: Xaa-Pro peptidase family protein [Actinomycetota bacterium]|nr:Xaa-Pro peptidase family protein [Actinomycetota bacterium]
MTEDLDGLPAPRQDRLVGGFSEHGLDAVVLGGGELVGWLTGYERYLGGPYALLVDRERKRTLLVPAYEEEVATGSAGVDAVVPFADRTLGMNLDLAGALSRRLREVVPAGALGAAGDVAGLLEGAQDVSQLVHDIRLRKDAEEVAAISEHFALALLGQRAVAEAAAPGVREIDLFSLAHSAPQSRAGRPLGFVSDLVSGPRAGAAFGPVNVASDRELEDGDALVADVLVGTAFWGDSARTTLIGDPPPQLREARDHIQAVLDGVASRLIPGTGCSEVYEWVRAEIAQRLPGWEFPHHAGHGVGASAFEDPHLIPADPTELETGMVLAVEPGAYLPGRYGVRIEDMFVVGQSGGIRLSD